MSTCCQAPPHPPLHKIFQLCHISLHYISFSPKHIEFWVRLLLLIAVALFLPVWIMSFTGDLKAQSEWAYLTCAITFTDRSKFVQPLLVDASMWETITEDRHCVCSLLLGPLTLFLGRAETLYFSPVRVQHCRRVVPSAPFGRPTAVQRHSLDISHSLLAFRANVI